MNEKKIEQYLVAQCKTLGAEIRKLKFIGQKGAPDRIIMYKGETFFVELKTPGKKLQSYQDREIKRMRAVGQSVYVIDSIKEVDAILRRRLYLK